MEGGYGELKEKHNVEKSEVVGHLYMPGGSWPEEEDDKSLNLAVCYYG